MGFFPVILMVGEKNNGGRKKFLKLYTLEEERGKFYGQFYVVVSRCH